MKIFTHSRSPKMRILSAFMAFLIIALTFSSGWLFMDLKSTTVNALSGPDIYSNTDWTSIDSLGKNAKGQTYSSMPASNHNGNFKYTGGIKAQTINVYDYLTNDEITGTWNSGINTSRVTGYTDPYTIFNTEISKSGGQLSASSNNITIVLQKFGAWAEPTDEVCIFMEDDDGNYITWPGDRMTYNYRNNENEFIYTFNPTTLGFTPTKIKFSKNGSNTIPTPDVGKGFRFKYDSSDFGYRENGSADGYKTGNTYYIKWNDRKIWEASGANTLYQSNYPYSLYFGCFLTSDADNANTYTTHTAPNYNNFYWVTNMAQRESTAGHASVQGLVDNELSGGVAGNITQNGVELPYFSSDWADNHKYNHNGDNKDIMKYWESGDSESSKIAFPFYEVLTDDVGNNNSAIRATTGVSGADYAKFYQFDSKDANLQFDSTRRIFQESTTKIKAHNDNDRVGFFPFNTSNNSEGSNINCGFGTKFEIDFTLNPDGSVELVNNKGEPVDGAGSVHARFEFTGDDDLWVFIDGKLMLDMGGAHNISEGYIDFYEHKAVAKMALNIDSVDKNNLGYSNIGSQEVTTSSPQGFTFDDRFGDGSFKIVNGQKQYTDKNHKMTIFYMERGMLDSNLLIRYNFDATSNFNKMKIQEITDFGDINSGLLDLTKKAADYDVFKYTVSNQGTDSRHIIDSTAMYPTNADHTRKVKENTAYERSTVLTKQNNETQHTYRFNAATGSTTSYITPDIDTDHPVDGVNTGVTYLWVDDFAKMNSLKKKGEGKGAGITTHGGSDAGSLYLMYGTEKNIAANTEKKESSAEFEAQFDRYSIMTVVQNDALNTTNPRSGDTDLLNAVPNPARTVTDYYDTDKYLYTRNDSPGLAVRETHHLTQGNSFYFANDNVDENLYNNETTGGLYTYNSGTGEYTKKTTVLDTSHKSDEDLTRAPQMTEYFVNKPKVGALTITKNLANSDSTATITEAFTFRLELTKIFGIEDVKVTNEYSAISAHKYDASGINLTSVTMTNVTEGTGAGTKYYGQFTLAPGEVLTIDKIPVGTNYKVVEIDNSTAYDPATRSHDEDRIVTGVLDGKESTASSNNAIIVNERVTNELDLVKNVVADAANLSTAKAESFNFTVKLEAPDGVSFKTGDTVNYNVTVTGSTPSSTVYSADGKTLTLVIPVSDTNTHPDPIKITGVPYNTKYTVTESLEGKTYWTMTGAENTSGHITSTVTATITNTFDNKASITLSKTDRSTGKLITDGTASFKLLKLKSGITWDDTKYNGFNTVINGYTNNTPTTDSTYVDAVYPSSGTLDTTDGELVINSTNHSEIHLTAGDQYFFYEVSAPTGYKVNNKVTADRIITLSTGVNNVNFPNISAAVTVKKTDENGNGLEGAELELYIHEMTENVTVDSSAVSAYSTEQSLGSDVNNSNLPVLYQTAQNSIAYTWSETADDPEYYYLRFNNSLNWTTVQANYISGGNTTVVSYDGIEGDVYKFKNNADAQQVYFSDGGTSRTITIDLKKYNDPSNNKLRYGYGYTYTPSELTGNDGTTNYTFDKYDGNYLVQSTAPSGTVSITVTTTQGASSEENRNYLYWEPGTTHNNNQYCKFYTDSSGNNQISPGDNNAYYIASNDRITGWTGINGHNNCTIRFVKIPSGANYVQFTCSDNNKYMNTAILAINTTNFPLGKYLSVNNDSQNSDAQATFTHYALPNNLKDGSEGTSTTSITAVNFADASAAPNETNTQLSASFQPEDRYGLITNIDSTADSNNFITITTACVNPYIDFYTTTSGGESVLEDGVYPKAATGMSLKAADLDGTTGSPYKIRIPKTAKSFQIRIGNKLPATTEYIRTPLYDGNDHLAGSSFVFNDSDTNASPIITQRTGVTATKSAISLLDNKTDTDYIYFTDVSNTLKGSGSTLYAYYYGGVDGAYINKSSEGYTDVNNASWYGVPAQYSYTDNSGNIVYVFQPPSASNGIFPYVIFNNGFDFTNSDLRITKAIPYQTGYNYTTDGSASIGYGKRDSVNSVSTYDYREYSEAGNKTGTKNTYSSSNYIYIINNGTSNFETNYQNQSRFILDDIHVEFFSDAAGTTAVEQASPGYRPAKTTAQSGGKDVYKIAVPSTAQYFRINNGQKKTNGSAKNNYRLSEIRQIINNGIYKFVDSSTATPSQIWNHGSATASIDQLDNYYYYLTLANKNSIPTSNETKLATVVTGSDGKQAYIKWLKGYTEASGGTPASYTNDDNYLDHVIGDIGQSASKTVVNVVKKQTGTTANDIYYYWKESKAPDGYSLSTDEHQVSYDSTTGNYTATVIDRPLGGTVTLTKTSKEQLGNTAIGSTLAGAKFRLVNITNGSEDYTMRFNEKTANTPGEYSGASGGAFNAENHWLETGTDGKLILHNIPLGDYYLEEMAAPTGYSNKDSNNQNKKVYFSMGKVGTEYIDKEISMTDEIAPAYIKLYEHINERNETAWGNPTFIFKITQTKYANGDSIVTANQTTHIVALTVDDNGKLTTDEILGSTYNTWYQESTDELEGESPNQTREYQGMYHIDNQGRIRLEPGTYSITRVPVSRYEFVADTWKLSDDDTANIYETHKHTETNQTMTGSEPAIQNVTIPQGKTALVHYYDKVAYYDKFSHVNEEINKFYTLDASKNNTTAKGIRVEFNGKVNTSGTATIDTAQANSTSAKTFNAWFINVDGTEHAMSADEKANLVISDPSNEFSSNFSYNSTSHQLLISNTSSYANNVNTLTATYDSKFITTFDLVFERTP